MSVGFSKRYLLGGEFDLEPDKRLLTTHTGTHVHLANRPFQVLVYLVEQRERVVSRRELLERFWDGRDVYDITLTKCVGAVRKALDDQQKEPPRFIETRWAEGYRFVGAVEERPPASALSAAENVLTAEAVATMPVADEAVAADHTEDVAEGNGVEGDDRAAPRAGHDALSPVTPPTVDARTELHAPMRRSFYVAALAVLLGVAAVVAYRRLQRPAPPLPARSVAVLPLKNLTGDPANDYFNDGMTESLINALSKIEGLKVISRSSVFSFRGKDVDPREAGRLLGVAAVVEGGVRKDADSVRVTVRLVSTEDGRVLWASNTHDRALGDIFALQDEIALGMAAGLRVPLTGEGARGLARHYTENVEAYQEYMRGRYWWDRRYREAFTKAIEHFNRAIALDPGYALAYAGIADCHLLLSPYGIAPPQEGYPKAKAAALKALEIDPLLVEAHVALAHLTWLYEWDWAKAERGFQRALELNPNDPAANHRYSVYLSSMGRHDEAIATALRARDLDPRSVTVSADVMRAYYHARRYDEVIVASRHTLDINPDAILPNSWLEMAYEQKGLYDESLAVRHRGMADARVPAAEIAEREATYKSVGWQGYWRREITIMEARAQQTYVMPYLFARVYARIGDRESALRWLEKAYAERADHLVLLNVDPLFDDLRSDPRFTALLTRVGFTALLQDEPSRRKT